MHNDFLTILNQPFPHVETDWVKERLTPLAALRRDYWRGVVTDPLSNTQVQYQIKMSTVYPG